MKIIKHKAQRGATKKRKRFGNEVKKMTKRQKVKDTAKAKRTDATSKKKTKASNYKFEKLLEIKYKISEVKIETKKQLMEEKMNTREIIAKSTLEAEILRKDVAKLKKALRENVKEENQKIKEIKSLQDQAKKDSCSFDAALKRKEDHLGKMIKSITQIRQKQQRCDEKHNKTKRILEEGLRENNSRDMKRRTELTRLLTEAEDAQNKCQQSLDKAQSSFESVQKNLHEINAKSDTSDMKIASLEKQLKEELRLKMLLEFKVKQKSSRIDAAQKKIDSESNFVEEIKKQKDKADTLLIERLTFMRKKILAAEVSLRQSVNEKGTQNAKFKELISQLQAAWKAVNE